jgi:hypothetical protein
VNDIIHPGAGLIFMKVGTHAREDLADIIKRKRQEIEDEGFSLWGYGGNTCHPLRVQPFARDFVKRDGAIYLCMQRIDSHHFALPQRAEEFSTDGLAWKPIPAGINVLGSRYALALGDLREETFELPLARTRVAVGTSAGRRGDLYVAGRVDKGCLEVTEEPVDLETPPTTPVEIGLVGRLIEPYAVLVR